MCNIMHGLLHAYRILLGITAVLLVPCASVIIETAGACFFTWSPYIFFSCPVLRSPLWSHPMQVFVDENCAIFDGEEENSLEMTAMHQVFPPKISHDGAHLPVAQIR